MTVRELIDRLGKCDPEATVLMADWNEGYEPPCWSAGSFDHPLVSVTTDGKAYVVIGEERTQLHPSYPFPFKK